MDTPVYDFLQNYKNSGVLRFHMPGHKGRGSLGCESFDITEINGADNLYDAVGIIKQSEDNAADLFGTEKTCYSTEGSSQCIRAMIYMASIYCKTHGRKYILAARNAHKAFLYALALTDTDVSWLYPKDMNSICRSDITPSQIESFLKTAKTPPAAVYLTSPDYLGGRLPIREIADICHKYNTMLLVDNAHGAYLHFLPERTHPLDLGADLCCDSAHKTLPVLTGGAYLHISKNAPKFFAENAKSALSLFGSTSPSYLTLCSLDLCNKYLAESYEQRLADKVSEIADVKKALINNGWEIEKSEPLKITLRLPESLSQTDFASRLAREKIEYEYMDRDYLVLMLSVETDVSEMNRLVGALGKNNFKKANTSIMNPVNLKSVLSVREALFSPWEDIPVDAAEGRVCASVCASCPPAVSVAVPGEVINKNAVSLLKYYGIDTISVIKNK